MKVKKRLKKMNKQQQAQQNKWIKENTAPISARYPKELVVEFKEACKTLGVSQSSLFRKVMEETIEKAKQK